MLRGRYTLLSRARLACRWLLQETCQLLRSIFLFLLPASLITELHTGLSVSARTCQRLRGGERGLWKGPPTPPEVHFLRVCSQWGGGVRMCVHEEFGAGEEAGVPRDWHQGNLLGQEAT